MAGRTASHLVLPLGIPVLSLASRARRIEVGDQVVACREWDLAEVAAFEPTVIIDCAFLTRNRTSVLPLQTFVAANRQMTTNLLIAATLASVRIVVTVSSGAAVYPVDALTSSSEPIRVPQA